jgi:hypothetical protein
VRRWEEFTCKEVSRSSRGLETWVAKTAVGTICAQNGFAWSTVRRGCSGSKTTPMDRFQSGLGGKDKLFVGRLWDVCGTVDCLWGVITLAGSCVGPVL